MRKICGIAVDRIIAGDQPRIGPLLASSRAEKHQNRNGRNPEENNGQDYNHYKGFALLVVEPRQHRKDSASIGGVEVIG